MTMPLGAFDAWVGRLVLRPGQTPSIVCERPMVGAALLGRLTQDRHAALLPELLASIFSASAQAQRATARRAIRAALGHADTREAAAHEARVIGMLAAREQLQRLALDLPARSDTAAPSPRWLREAPLLALPSLSAGSAAWHSAQQALQSWWSRRVLGMPAPEWLAAWQAERGDWLARWSVRDEHPLTQWLLAMREDALALAWPCRALDASAPGLMRTLAAAIADDERFAEQPTWLGAPAETGPWTRAGRSEPVATAWDRLGARIADLTHLTQGEAPSLGALTLGEGEGIAWTEMSRGLLVHWVRLEGGADDLGHARVARYHVLAPTEWNFHPDGGLGRLLAAGGLAPARVRLAAATLDPCLEFSLEPAKARHA